MSTERWSMRVSQETNGTNDGVHIVVREVGRIYEGETVGKRVSNATLENSWYRNHTDKLHNRNLRQPLPSPYPLISSDLFFSFI